MAKAKEKRIAFDYYTLQGMSAKAISEIIGVTEKTIGGWIQKGNWAEVRNANINGSKKRSNNIKELISELTEQQLEIVQQVKEAQASKDDKKVIELRKQSAAISQEVAIQNKALEKMEKEGKISLAVYLEVMNDIFKNMEQQDKNSFLKTLDFQEQHLQTITMKLG